MSVFYLLITNLCCVNNDSRHHCQNVNYYSCLITLRNSWKDVIRFAQGSGNSAVESFRHALETRILQHELSVDWNIGS